MAAVILIYPSARPMLIAEAIARAKSATKVSIKVAVGYNHDHALNELDAECPVYFGPNRFDPPYTAAVNLTMKAAAICFRPKPDDLIGYWSDDFYPETGWAEALLASRDARPDKRFLCPWEPLMYPKISTAPFATWGWYRDRMNGMFWNPMLKYVVDVWNSEVAKFYDDFIEVPACRIYHRHYYNGQRRADDIDIHNNNQQGNDREVIESMRSRGFPALWANNVEDIDFA